MSLRYWFLRYVCSCGDPLYVLKSGKGTYCRVCDRDTSESSRLDLEYWSVLKLLGDAE